MGEPWGSGDRVHRALWQEGGVCEDPKETGSLRRHGTEGRREKMAGNPSRAVWAALRAGVWQSLNVGTMGWRNQKRKTRGSLDQAKARNRQQGR